MNRFTVAYLRFLLASCACSVVPCALITAGAYSDAVVERAFSEQRSLMPVPSPTPELWSVGIAPGRMPSEGGAQGVRPERSPSADTESVVLEKADGDRSYEVTAYSHGCTMPRDGGRERPPQRAANGRWPVADHTVAADTAVHPFGTEVLIEGVGFRTVGDRGHAIKGRRLDLFVDSCKEARRFGRRWLRVFPVPVETTKESN